jgi:large conductance mechanosensitive channel
MKKLWDEFRGFLNKGDFITIAVGLVMALYFQKIVDALLDGVINPIIAAIFGKSDFTDIGFAIGDARISIGLVIDAIISFVVVGFLLFLILKAYDRMRRTKEEPEGETELSVLREIRDSLGSGRSS